MVDRELIAAKAGLVVQHVTRLKEKAGQDLNIFLGEKDRQDIVSFNLHLAIENCTDIASHIISEEGLGLAGSANEMFYILEENSYIDRDLTERMIKAVGLRNLIVHEYARIDQKKLFEIAQKDIEDLNEFLHSIFQKLGMTL